MTHSHSSQGFNISDNISVDLLLKTSSDRDDPLYSSRDLNPISSELYKSPFPYSGYTAKPVLDDLGRVLIYAVSKDLVRAGPADAEHPAYRTTTRNGQIELYSDTFLNR